uniref:CC chemokine receptor type 3like [Xiphosphorus maculatus] n=1 Tax=Lepeophtheirus salmonis TaxID=72036 RepID=A0A0K2UHB4_LEPSM
MQIFFSLGTLIIQFVIPFVVIVVVYVGVLRRLKSRKRSVHQSRNRNRAKTLKLIGFVMLNFVITWAPYNVINFLFDLSACDIINLRGFGKILRDSHGFIQLLAIEHSCINPITYALYHKDIRKTLIKWTRTIKGNWTPQNTEV